jgi:hypothetical protein
VRRIPLLFAATALVAGAVLADAPARAAPPELPTLQQIYERAKEAKKAADAAAEAAKRNPILEKINAYRDGVTALKSYTFLTDVVKDAKDAKTAPYRMEAARALVDRFHREGTNDVLKRKIRREIGLELVGMMKAPSTDKTGLQAVDYIFNSWWKAQIQAYGFKPGGKFRDRAKAAREMSSYLKRRGN